MQCVDIKNYSEECLHNIVNMIIMKNDIIYDMKEYIIRINDMYYTLLVQLCVCACVCVGVCVYVGACYVSMYLCVFNVCGRMDTCTHTAYKMFIIM